MTLGGFQGGITVRNFLLNSSCPTCGSIHPALTESMKERRVCPDCGGEAFSFSLLRNAGQKALVGWLELDLKSSHQASGRNCLDCHTPMHSAHLSPDVELDYCLSCRLLWLDSGEARAAFRRIQ
jgi:Zn-finger nucleic acid-binding protein